MMRQYFMLAYLPFKNQIDQTGRVSYGLKVTVFSFLNILLLATLFTRNHGDSLSLELLAAQYIYFIPLIAMSAAVGSFETELYSGIAENLQFAYRQIFITRLFSLSVELIVPFLFYAVLFVLTGAPLGQWLNLIAQCVVFSLLGISIGFFIGFKHEKAINNFLHGITWVLALGPGPFLGVHPKWYQFLFPGSQALQGHYGLELLKLTFYLFIALILFHIGRRPRPYRLFMK